MSPGHVVRLCLFFCREDPDAGPTVAGLSKVKVDSVDTIFALLQVCLVRKARSNLFLLVVTSHTKQINLAGLAKLFLPDPLFHKLVLKPV